MFAFKYVTEFSYTVDAEKIVAVAESELKKMAEYPVIVQEIHNFVSDVAAFDTEYAVYVDVEKNSLGYVRTTNRTVYIQN